MKKLKRKLFIAPLIPIAGTALTALDIGMGVKGGAEAKEQAEEQAKRDRKISKQLEEIANSQNPQAGQAAAQVLQQRGYSGIGSILKGVGKNAVGFGKDMGKLVSNHKKSLIIGTASGATLVASSYLTDKAIQADQKKSGQKEYSAGSVLKSIGKGAWNNKGKLIFPAAIGALPAIGYVTDKKIKSDMANEVSSATATNKEKKFSTARILSKGLTKGLSKMKQGFGGMKKGWETFKSHPGQSILGGVSNITGGGGTKGVKNIGKEISDIGEKSGNAWTKSLGKGIQKNTKTALAASVPVGLGIMGATWGTGEKVVNKTARAADKNAFKYQDSQNQQIQ